MVTKIAVRLKNVHAVEVIWMTVECNLSIKHSMVNKLVNDRLDNDRDAKIIITSRNSETGTGKTTLAILLAKYWDRNGWNSTKGFQDINEYLAYYLLKARAGDVLIFDDAQAGADSRRSTSKENVRVTKYWTILRSKNIVSILTLPTQTMLDKRLLELADIWLNVRTKGEAVPYRIYVDDIKKYVRTYRVKNPDLGLKEVIRFKKYRAKDYLDMEVTKDKFTKSEFEKDFGKEMSEFVEV